MLCFLRCVPTLERVVVSYELAQRFFDVRRSLQLTLLLRAELQMGPICTHSSSSVRNALSTQYDIGLMREKRSTSFS